VVTAKVEFPAVVPLNATDAGFMVHVGRLVAPDGLAVTAHVKLTVPVKPAAAGVTAMVEVFPVVAPGAIEIGGPLRLKLPPLLPPVMTTVALPLDVR
jgi:hypothetical protein